MPAERSLRNTPEPPEQVAKSAHEPGGLLTAIGDCRDTESNAEPGSVFQQTTRRSSRERKLAQADGLARASGARCGCDVIERTL